MPTVHRDDVPADAPPDGAGRLRDAEFVRIVSRADGDGVAAAGVLARALASADVPFQVTVAPTVEERRRRTSDDEVTVTVGAPTPDGIDLQTGEGPESSPASVAAWALARELGDADPFLALAGSVAGGAVPGTAGTTPILEAAREAGLDRRPGVGIPTDDLVAGLASSTLVHAPFSGDPAATRDALAGVVDPDADPSDPEVGRAVASLVAIEAAGGEGGAPRAAETVEGALRPYVPGGPVATVEGYAGLLDAVARETPGTGVALALGHDVVEAALDVWSERGRRAHEAVRTATTGRYDGLFASRTDHAPVVATARILYGYRSPEPVAAVIAEGEAAAVGDPARSVGEAVRVAAGDVGGEADGTPRWGYATFDGIDPSAFVAALRGAL